MLLEILNVLATINCNEHLTVGSLKISVGQYLLEGFTNQNPTSIEIQKRFIVKFSLLINQMLQENTKQVENLLKITS